MQTRRPNIFLNKLISLLWDDKTLKNRALDLGRVREDLQDRSPMKLIEKSQLRLLISKILLFVITKEVINTLMLHYYFTGVFNDFLKKKTSNITERIDYLLSVTRVISSRISNLRTPEQKKIHDAN